MCSGSVFDWGDDRGGIGGISQGQCRMFLTNPQFREQYGTAGAVMIWLNLDSKHEVDELYQRWREAGARILAEPEDEPWQLREFRSAIWTAINYACSMTSRGSCGRSRRGSRFKVASPEIAEEWSF